MTDIPTLAEAESVAGKFLDDLKDLQEFPQRFADAINEGLELIPIEWIAHKAEEMWDYLKSLLSELLDILKDIARFVKFPYTMAVEYFKWSDIKDDISNAAGRVDPANYTALLAAQDQNWEGAGARSYAKCSASQAGSLNQVKDIADGAASAFGYAAIGGITLYIGLGVLLVDSIAEFTTEAAAAETGVGTLAAIGAAIQTAVKSKTVARALIGAAGTFFTSQGASFVTLESKLHDDSKFPDRHWPDPGAHVWSN